MIKRYDLKNENIGMHLEGYSKVRTRVCDWYVLNGSDGEPASVALALTSQDNDALNFVHGLLYSGAPLVVVPKSRLFVNGPGRITARPELVKLVERQDPVHAYLATRPAKERVYLPSVLTFSYAAPPTELYNPLPDMSIEWR